MRRDLSARYHSTNRLRDGSIHIRNISKTTPSGTGTNMKAYITALGKFLPGPPIDNDSMEEYIGMVGSKPSRVRQRVLSQNGIESRHYAIDRQQNTLFSNAEMAARAARQAIERAGLDLADIDFLAAATSQGDLPLPGFASMVHGEIKCPPCEIATAHGVCASGVMALKSAALQITGGGKRHAVVCASEFASRLPVQIESLRRPAYRSREGPDLRHRVPPLDALGRRGIGCDLRFTRRCWVLPADRMDRAALFREQV